jgi:hypothetical protein
MAGHWQRANQNLILTAEPAPSHKWRTHFQIKSYRAAFAAALVFFKFKSGWMENKKEPDLRPALLVMRFIRLHQGAQKAARPTWGRCPGRATSKTSLPTLNGQRNLCLPGNSYHEKRHGRQQMLQN